MTPYYDDGNGIVIYHGDCREILPYLRADAVITDPPYNVGKDYGTHNDSMSYEDYKNWITPIVHCCLIGATNQFWCIPLYKMELYLRLLPKAHLVIIRRGAIGPLHNGWTNQYAPALAFGRPSRIVPDLWEGIRLKGEGYFFREETYEHPGYTPSPILELAIELFSTQSIIDPFCGTGTTLRAAKDLGRKAIGIEIEEKYCEIAAKRLAQEVLPL